MIYFDNAATTMAKPPEVVEAVAKAMASFGGVGRGVHPASLAAGRAVFDARSRVAHLFDAPDASCVSFAANASAALNIAIQGLLPDGGRAITTAASHNSVLRPLNRARDERSCSVEVVPVGEDASIDFDVLPDGGRAITTAASHNSVLRPLNRARDERSCSVEVVPVGEDASIDFDVYRRALSRGDVDLVCATHSSNVTGDVYDIALMARLAHEAGALFVLDAAQTAGALPFSMRELDVDVVCFTGHKSLLGPQGTGGVCCMPHVSILDAAQTAGALPFSMRELDVDVVCFTGHKSLLGPQGTGGVCCMPHVSIRPLLEGGSGFDSYAERHPRIMPEALEAGTLNAHGIAGLAAGVAFVEERGVARIAEGVRALTDRFEGGVAALSRVRILGGRGGVDRTGIVAIDAEGVDPSELSDMLAFEFDICTRAGAHCAPLMHESLGTADRGAVRFSFSSSNTLDEVDDGLIALERCLVRLR